MFSNLILWLTVMFDGWSKAMPVSSLYSLHTLLVCNIIQCIGDCFLPPRKGILYMADKLEKMFWNFFFVKFAFLCKIWLKPDIYFRITSSDGKQRDRQTGHFRWILPLETSLKRDWWGATIFYVTSYKLFSSFRALNQEVGNVHSDSVFCSAWWSTQKPYCFGGVPHHREVWLFDKQVHNI